MLYKIILKSITAYMSNVMDFMVGDGQVAFVTCRFIHDNAILAHKIIHGYRWKNMSTRCMIKMDL